MSEETSQERTEEATPKRQKELREKGQVARSKDLNTTILLVATGLAFILFGANAVEQLVKIFQIGLAPDPKLLLQDDGIVIILKAGMQSILALLIPILLISLVAIFIGPLIVGRWVFATENIKPKLERLDPIKGLMKIFSVKALMEVLKSVLKFSLVLMMALLLFYVFFEEILLLSSRYLEVGLKEFSSILQISFFALTGSLIIIALIDVPFQIAQHNKQVKMTKQEVKDESKETEGNPEVKSKLAQLRKELSKRRMMNNVPEADVIITNPTHFAVALKYDDKKMKAPILVAKGADNIAAKIRQIGDHHKIPIVQMPLLARAVFYNTEIDDEIPSALYVACAQVLAYVYKLKMYKKGKMAKPKLPDNLSIPSEMVK